MKTLKNINWNKELELDTTPEENYIKDNWIVAFEYNGNKLFADVSFDLTITEFCDKGDYYTPDYFNHECTDMQFQLNNVFDEEYNDWDKDLINIENQLESDLKTYY